MPPNFSENEKIGKVSELKVATRLMEWGWDVGEDFIDIGYDLFVQPDKDRYHGSRFLVQVKGTVQKRKKAGLIAPVPKSRLADYSRNPIAVFLIRVAPDGRFYWLHMQEWAKHNRSRMAGSGIARIPMDASCELSSREDFEAYLDKVLAPPSKRAGSLADLADARSMELSEIDPNFLVRVGVKNGHETHELFARSENAAAQLTFKPERDGDNFANLKDAIEYGLPRTVAVSEFQMTGSPLFEAMGITRSHTGALTIQGKARKGFVRIYAGEIFSPQSQCLEIEAELFSGPKGLAISSESMDGLFMVEARLQLPGGGRTTFSIRPGKLNSVPLQNLSEFAAAGPWAEQVMEHQAILPELFFDGKKARLSPSSLKTENIRGWLHQVWLLGRMHLIARCLDLDFIMPEECDLSEKEVEDISFAYRLLRGIRVSVNSISMEFEPTTSAPVDDDRFGLWATTNLSITAGGQDFAALPVVIDMPGYVVDPVPDSSRLRIHHPTSGAAYISYHPEGETDILIRRIRN